MSEYLQRWALVAYHMKNGRLANIENLTIIAQDYTSAERSGKEKYHRLHAESGVALADIGIAECEPSFNITIK